MTRIFGAPVSSRGHRVVAGLVVWSLALPTRAAPSDAAAPEGQSDVLLEQAADAYDRADFEASIAAFEAAYALEGDPACLFNIGRVHEEAGQLRRALERYQEFILQPQVALEDRAMANERIRVLRALLENVEETPPHPAAAPPERAQGADEVAPSARNPMVHSSRGLIVGGGVSGGVGLAVAAVGAVFQGLSRTTAGDVASAPSRQERDALVATARRQATTGDALLISGAVLVTVGVPLLAVGLARRGRNRRLAVGRVPEGWALRF